MLNYTKGEWTVEDETNIFCGDRLIATAGGYSDNYTSPRAENKANARLITQAPRMYEALKQIQRWLLGGTEIEGDKAKLFNTQFVKANNLTVRALAKVEGGK